MSDREKAVQLINDVLDYKLGYIIAYLQGAIIGDETPNEKTLAAMEELKNGGGECFDTLDELWESLEGEQC